MRRLWIWLRPLVGIGILALLAWRLGTDAFVDGLRVIDLGTVLAALGIGLVVTVCSAGRWCLVARALGLWLSMPQAIADYYRALLLNGVLPAGMLGDVHRAVSHGRESGQLGRAARAVVLERTAGQVVLVLAGAVALFTEGFPVEIVPVVVIAAVVLGGCAGLVVLYRRMPADSRIHRALTTMLVDARQGLLSRRALPGVAVLSVIVLVGHIALFLVATRAAGVTASVGRLVPLLLVVLVAMAVPISVGGWGPREAACAWVFGLAGLGAAQGLTTAVVYGVLALVSSLPGALVLFLRRRRRIARPEIVKVSAAGLR